MNIKKLRDLEVVEDPELYPVEKETYFHITGTDTKTLKVTSNMKTVMEHMLQCDDLEVTNHYLSDDNELIHLEGKLPVTYLRFKTKGRTRNYLSRVLD